MGILGDFRIARRDHERWGETPSSPDLQWVEIRARRESRPTWFMEKGHRASNRALYKSARLHDGSMQLMVIGLPLSFKHSSCL